MSSRHLSRHRALLALFGCLATCGCGQANSVQKVLGSPRFVETHLVGGPDLVDQDIFDFGPALLGSRLTQSLPLRNDGRAPVTVTAVERSPGLSPAFDVDLAPGFVLDAGAETTLRLTFAPTEPGEVRGTIYLRVANADRERLTIDFAGVGVEGKCSMLPGDAVSFGAVALGAKRVVPVRVLNDSIIAWSFEVVGFDAEGSSSSSDGAFALAADFAAGPRTVAARGPDGTPGEVVIPVEFTPHHLGVVAGALKLSGGPGCLPNRIVLTGEGVEHTLDCGPRADRDGVSACELDFGYVSPGVRIVKAVQFTNRGNDPVTLTLSEPVQPPGHGAPYAIVGGARQIALPKGGAPVAVEIAFQPSDKGAQPATLPFLSDDPSQPRGTVALRGVGGGPEVEVNPAQLDFDQVAIGAHASRRVDVVNMGTDVRDTLEDNLRLASDETGSWVEKRPVFEGDAAGEFSVAWPPRGYEADGLAEGQSATLRVLFTPVGAPGTRAATLKIFTNDPARPVVAIPVAANAVALPPCDYDVVPPALNFGTLTPGKSLIARFSIVNHAANAADYCLVSSLELTTDANSLNAFALVNGPVESVQIPGGSSLSVPVRFSPGQAGSFAGDVHFEISNPSRTEATVALSGTGANTCLMFAPQDLDFGTVGVNCGSMERTASIYNTCTTTVTLTSIALLPSTPALFTLTRHPALPVAVPPNGQTSFAVRYAPTAAMTDSTLVVVTASTSAAYSVPVTGTGAPVAVQTDVFSQASATPKADVLLVIDNSCSMADNQAALADNFASFIQYATSRNVDYHIAATTVSLDFPRYECGRFVPLSGSNPRVITPTTPNKEWVFQQNVNLGTDGTNWESSLRPGYLALSAPLVTTHNAGFYRDDATLAIVAISDDMDYDPYATPSSFYESFFLNLKGFRRRNDFSFNGIIPTSPVDPPGPCLYGRPSVGNNGRVKGVIADTGGLMDDICSPDWAQTLRKIGNRAFGQRSQFFLSNVPDMSGPDPISVVIDGQPFPALGAHGEQRWSYDSVSNSIVFDPLAAPDAGSSTVVTYTVACL